MESDKEEAPKRRPLVVNNHKKRSVITWIIPLLVIVGFMFFLPRILDRIG